MRARRLPLWVVVLCRAHMTCRSQPQTITVARPRWNIVHRRNRGR